MLHAAAKRGQADVVRMLIGKGADVNARNKFGSTPLHAAVKNGHAKVAAILLRAGADPAATNKKGVTPLKIARKKGHKRIIRMLKKAGELWRSGKRERIAGKLRRPPLEPPDRPVRRLETDGPSPQEPGRKEGEKVSAALPVSEVDRDIPTTNVTNTNAIAVVIGNRNYVSKDIPSVDYAINDAETVRKYLINVLGYREGNIIYEPDASKGKFEATFGTHNDYRGKLYNYLKKGKSDIFVYYSGHGAPDTESKEAYFVPVDADPQAIGLTGYPLEQLYENIAKISEEMEPPNVFIVVDACFSGSTEKGLLLKNVSPISVKVKTPLVNMRNAVVMTSSSGEEVSSWYPEKGHSMFTYFFLKGLKDMAEKSRKKITAREIYDFITDDTEGLPYYARRLHGRIQTPQIIGDGNRVLVGR